MSSASSTPPQPPSSSSSSAAAAGPTGEGGRGRSSNRRGGRGRERGRGGGGEGGSKSEAKPTTTTATTTPNAPSLTQPKKPAKPRDNNRTASTNRSGNSNKNNTPPSAANVPSKPSNTPTDASEASQRDEHLQQEKAAAALALAEQKRLELRKKKDLQAAVAALEKRTTAVREAILHLTQLRDTAKEHAASRDICGSPSALAQARTEFDTRKKNLKADLKKCTAFVKRIKSGALYMSSSSEAVVQDIASLNLSRYVEEVVSALLESKPKVTDVPVVVALAQAMHLRYPDFLPNFLPALWSVVVPTSSSTTSSKKGTETGSISTSGNGSPAEVSKHRRVYVRILTDFLLHGLLSTADVTRLLAKCLPDWTGAAANYAVTDAVATVALSRTAGFQVLGVTSSMTLAALGVIRTELEANNASSIDSEAPEETTVVASTETCTKVPASVDSKLMEKAQLLVNQLASILAEQRAVTPELSRSVLQHCLGAYQTLSTSLVQTHHKLRKLEKRCEQDRLVSGQLTPQREKGLTDAHKLCDSLRKSVDALSDCLNQPTPTLALDAEGDDHAAFSGSGVEVWTKEMGGQGTENLGPFDDEETRAFYCDIPDLLTTIPPALLGISEDDIEARQERNASKYGAGAAGGITVAEDEFLLDTNAAAESITSEAQLEAAEQGEILADDDEDAVAGDKEENKDTPHYRLMLLLEQELPECNRREQIDEIAEKFCINHGSSKNSRKRLLKTLFLVPRSRLDLLPYYSRLVATVDRVWNDVASSLATDLEQQFHGQAKFKKNQNFESRLRTARYIGELIKFRAAPPIVILRCIERCLEDFTGNNVEVACSILESCGRYMYRLKHTHGTVTAVMETMTRLSKAKNLDERLQSLLKAAFYSVKPPPSGPRKKAKAYPPLESYVRNLLLVRLDPNESVVSLATKQLVRLPWNDPSYQCGALVCKIMLKACRKGRYKTIEAVAAVATKLRTQRAASEVTVRLVDAVVEELRWSLEHPNFRDQQRVITYTRLFGEFYRTNLITGIMVIDQLYSFINLGHEIPDSLRKVSKQLAAQAAAEEAAGVKEVLTPNLPVFDSSGGGATQVIQEDEEMEESELVTTVIDEQHEAASKCVAVSPYSMFDPRVSSQKDPPNSSYRITLVCTLLEVVAKSIVSRNNLPRLKGFLTAFQRYLFTKTSLPTDVEFTLLDTFDLIDSQWKRACGSAGRVNGKAGDSGSGAESGFPHYATWLDTHLATVAVEEADAIFEEQKRSRLDALADESKSIADLNVILDERSLNDDETGSLMEDDDDDETLSLKSKDSTVTKGVLVEDDAMETCADELERLSESDDGEDESDDESETDEEDEEDDEVEEFDEVAYMRQLEEEAFERELRMITMEAIEKGKIASRKQVGDSMISGSQIVKRKPNDPTKPSTTAPSAPTTGVALGGEVGISFQVLKKGSKGKVEAKELVVPIDTNLAMVATRHDDAAARERDEIKQRVLRYEAQSGESAGGNVYLEQEKLQKNRNRPLSMDVIDKNFGTSGGNLHPSQLDKKPASAPINHPAAPGRGIGNGGGVAPGRVGGRGRSGGRAGRSNTGGRALYG